MDPRSESDGGGEATLTSCIVKGMVKGDFT